jgi:hypothetical protein
MIPNDTLRRLIYVLVMLLMLPNSGCSLDRGRRAVETPAPFLTSGEAAEVETPCALPKDIALTERWIQVSLRGQVVRLCEGRQVLSQFLAATGIGDSPEATTFPGLFTVYEKNMGPFHLPEYGVYVSHWVGFDQEHANGFHSLPMDASGHVLDGRLGEAVSHGCVRTAQPAEVFRFAEFGMKVYVH